MQKRFFQPLITLAAVVATVGITSVIAADDDKAAPAHEVDVIMKKGFKGDESIVKKIINGAASDEEKALFVEYCDALQHFEPEIGTAGSWKQKTASLLKAAKSGDPESIKKASNCKACHSKHKPRRE